MVEKRYVRADRRGQLISSAKLKIDDVALAEVIDEFEQMLTDGHSEADWGQFLRRNLYLVESRYDHVFDRLNVITGASREVDFGLIDTHGFLDIFEIKTPSTNFSPAVRTVATTTGMPRQPRLSRRQRNICTTPNSADLS